VMSARRPEDVAMLHKKIVEFYQQDQVEAELFLPWEAQQLRKDIYATCQVLAETSDHEGAFFKVRGEPSAINKLTESVKLSQGVKSV